MCYDASGSYNAVFAYSHPLYDLYVGGYPYAVADLHGLGYDNIRNAFFGIKGKLCEAFTFKTKSPLISV